MFKVVITNKTDYCREVQYFRRNQWKVVAPFSSIEFTDVDEADTFQINYYKSLENSNFQVSFVEQDHSELKECVYLKSDDDPSCSRAGQEEEKIKSLCNELRISDLDDDQIRKVLDSLGISTRLRSRWKIEKLIEESIPEGKVLSDYLRG